MSEKAQLQVGRVEPARGPVETSSAASTRPRIVRPQEEQDLVYWRRLAVETGQRLQIAETQAKDLRAAADDVRARFTKYKGRLDTAQATVNDLQAQLVAVSAERDALRDRVADVDALLAMRETTLRSAFDAEVAALRDQIAKQETLARKVYEFRQSIIDGPLWELFAELAVESAGPAGGK